jgi:DNA-directed RNA polymerase subunit F
MIKEKKPITIAETRELIKDFDTDKAKEVSLFLKKFDKTHAGDAKKMFDAIKKLNIEKLKDDDVVKIVDLAPEDAEDLRKIFFGSDITLDQDEITKILEITKSK